MNKVGKIACIVLIAILIVIMIISNNSSASTGTMSVNSNTASAGDEITATINLSDDNGDSTGNGATAIKMTLQYDKDVFEYKEYSTDIGYTSINEDSEGRFRCTNSVEEEKGEISIYLFSETAEIVVKTIEIKFNVKDSTAESGVINIKDDNDELVQFKDGDPLGIENIENSTISVTINKSETEGVVLNKSVVNLSIPNNTTETVEVTAGKPVTWSSSNPNIATVESDADGNGVITAVAVSEEPITITATSTTDPTKTASVTVTVTNDAPQSTELKLSAYEVNIQKGSTETVLVTEGGPVTWNQGNTGIATVVGDADGNGVITAVEVGTTTITATSTTDSTKTASVTVNVIDSGNPSEKEVPIPNKTNISMIKGDLAQVSITNNIEVDWKSNDESVVTVDENGNIYAVDVGETTIDAISKVDSNKKASIKISVTDKNSGSGNQNAGNQNAGNQNGGNQDTGNQVAGNQAGGNSTGGIVTGGSTTNGTKTQSGNSSSAINEAVPATGESSVETVALLVIITLIVASIVFRSKSKIK